MAGGVISHAVKMGEGWLLTAEMLELAHSGCDNVVCTQPFGCLPDHICGKGMMKPIKELCPNANIVAIDYDAGASRVKQENRLKLMLTNARKKKTPSGATFPPHPSICRPLGLSLKTRKTSSDQAKRGVPPEMRCASFCFYLY